ncbi:MAG: type II toxin-antitoxin system RelE/ParE family toxin [Spirochaetaceae bacterium]|jgi:mRNA interferase RelE/StbE|nr:type II toxin-antitoxin system RelE/ParE family toxin [Spirochaetaceae bacterium]
MAWKIKLSTNAEKQLRKLDKPTAKRILKYLRDTVKPDPKSVGKYLKGNLADLWRYRVGDYRVICTFENGELIVLVLEIGHRREIYKKK